MHGNVNEQHRQPQITAHPFVWRAAEDIPRRQCIYPDVYYRQFVTATVGAGSVGKSGLTLAECMALATGNDLLGVGSRFRIGFPLRVWYWNGEDPLVELERQVHAIMHHYGLTEADLDNRLFVDSGRLLPIDLVRPVNRDGFVVNAIQRGELIATIRRNRIDLAVFDPIVQIVSANSNINEVMNALVSATGEIATHCNCAIGLVHHPRKGNGGEITAEDARGGSALVCGTRVTRVLNRMTADEGEKAGIPGKGYKRYFRVGLDKINLSPPQEDTHWYYLENVTLPNGDPDDQFDPEGDRIRVVVKWQWPNAFNDLHGWQIVAFQDALDKETARIREDQQSPDWVGHLLGEVLGIDTGRFIRAKDDRTPDQNAARSRCATIIKAWLESDSGLLVRDKIEDKKKNREIPVIRVGERYAP